MNRIHVQVPCFLICILFYFSFIWLRVYAFVIDSMVQCGSACEPGASGLPYYCTPPVCIPDVIGTLAVWRQNTKKKLCKKSGGPSQAFCHAQGPLTPRYSTPTPFATILARLSTRQRVLDVCCVWIWVTCNLEVPTNDLRLAPLCTCHHVRFAFQTRHLQC